MNAPLTGYQDTSTDEDDAAVAVSPFGAESVVVPGFSTKESPLEEPSLEGLSAKEPPLEEPSSEELPSPHDTKKATEINIAVENRMMKNRFIKYSSSLACQDYLS